MLLNILLDFQWHDLLQPQFYIDNGGLWLLLFIVFAETGLFVGFFLPGDSLLFVAGIFAHEIKTKTNIIKPGLGYQVLQYFGISYPYSYWIDLTLLIVSISLMGILGNLVGYWFGKKIGPAMYQWRDTIFFKKRYLQEAHDFADKHGSFAIVAARFVPFVRTFAPIVAGIVRMDKKHFQFYNVLGSVAWVSTMILGGFFLQRWMFNIFHFDLKQHLEIIVLGIVLVTTLPVLFKLFFGKRKKPSEPPAS
ncbi:MAG: DedA family protein [Chitinophagaceae bacterium]|jgi:membrane-associated protein|nr:DedA family protein [Chitinophagaceae bacterium]